MTGASCRRCGFALVLVSVLASVWACSDDKSKSRSRYDRDDDDDDRKPATSASAIASATQSASGVASAGESDAEAPGAKRPDPIVMKTYRAQACYYGSLALKQGRAAYVRSLGGKPPSATRIPSFGGDEEGSASAPPAPSTRSSASASAGPRPLARGLVRFDQFVRHCNTAVTIKDIPDADLDPVLKSFSDWALPFARVMQDGAAYYSGSKYKDDAFARGKELHECLMGTGTCETKEASAKTVTRAFDDLDGKLASLRAAVDRFMAAKPVDKSGFTPTQAASSDAVRDATALLLAFDATPLSATAINDAISKVDAAITALKAAETTGGPPDPWVKGVVPQLEILVREARTLSALPVEKITPSQIYRIVTLHNRVLEKDYASLQAKLRGAPGGGRLPVPRKIPPKYTPPVK